MVMLRAGLAVAALFIGSIAALLGAILVLSALKTGSIQLSHGAGSLAVAETVLRTVDGARYWRLVFGLGFAPFILGSLAVNWGWRRINR